MMRRLLITLLAVAFTECRAEHHAQSVLTAYKAAVANKDIPTFVRLADPNMRALIEREELRKDATVKFIDTITTRPQRVVRTTQGVAYRGWVREQCGTCEWNLMAVVVGEGRAISKALPTAQRCSERDDGVAGLGACRSRDVAACPRLERER
jgi:hypothetical protein